MNNLPKVIEDIILGYKTDLENNMIKTNLSVKSLQVSSQLFSDPSSIMSTSKFFSS